MACYSPLQGFRSRYLNKNGNRPIVFDARMSYGMESDKVTIPCGQCVGCRLEYSRQWAIRCVHEASLHEKNCFITLTLSPDSIFDKKICPKGYSLDKSHVQKFMKRLRRRLNYKIKYFYCGEYGDTKGRPHYHILIFGHDFSDKVYWKTVNGIKLFVSEELDSLWPFGFSTIGEVSFQSAAYVARYSMKKVNGLMANTHYMVIDPDTGEIYRKEPEYCHMSRRPSIGKEWYDKYKGDVYPHDFMVVNKVKMKPPKYYDRCFELDYPEGYEKLKRSRKRKAKLRASDNTLERLSVREKVQELRLRKLKRIVDMEN